MRSIAKLLFACTMLVSSVSQAQEWAPEGATWYYTMYSMGGYRDPVKMTVNKDTIIQSKSCHAVTYFLGHGKQFLYEENKKLYFFDTVMNTFHTLYDFEGDTGTSWLLPISYNYMNNIV